MKKFLAFLLVPFLLALGEQFPPVSNEIVEINDFPKPVCMIQNAKDSLIYIAALPDADEGKKEIVVVNSNLEVVSRIDSAAVGFAIGYLRCIDYDAQGNVWIGATGGKIYCLKSGVLEEKILTTEVTSTIQCFETKVLITTNAGYYVYNSETDSVEDSGFTDKRILGAAIDNEENVYLAVETNSTGGEPIIAYKAINNGSDWIEQNGSDSCLKDFLEWQIINGTMFFKHISFLSLFKGQVFIGGQQSLLIKNIGPGQWEECNFQDGPSFIGQASFDSLGNLWSANNYQISKFNVEEKIETVYGYDENNLPPVRAMLCGSAFNDKIIYIATKGQVIKHNTDPTNTINDYNPKMVIKSAFVPTRIYNLRGQLVRTFAPNIKIELSRIDLSTGTYLLRDGSGSKKVFIKGL